MLTRKQYDLLSFIDLRLADSGVSPSFEEMKDSLSLKSKSGVHRLINALEERGFIRRLPNRARALEVLRMPELAQREAGLRDGVRDAGDRGDGSSGGVSGVVSRSGTWDGRAPDGGTLDSGASGNGAAGDGASGVAGSVIHADFRRSRAAPANDVVELPLHGRIAAGQPIEAFEDDRMLSVPSALLGPGDHYALEVAGDSMIDAGILDGDYALVRRCDTARDGDIVVALVDDSEATLKILKFVRNMIELEPANAAYPTQRYPAARVRVQGKLAGLLRRYA